jgi:hypothetical protein
MSWEQLLAIRQEAAEVAAAELAAPPQACPLCGEPLREGPGAVLFCPFGDGYEWPRDGR